MAAKKSITDFVIVQEYLKSIAGDYANEKDSNTSF